MVTDRSQGDSRFDEQAMPDYIYIGKDDPDNWPNPLHRIVDASLWQPRQHVYPCFTVAECAQMQSCESAVKFLRLTDVELTDALMAQCQADPAVVLLLSTHHRNAVGALRAAMHRLMHAGCEAPVVLELNYQEQDVESLQLKSAADLGALLLDGFQDGVLLRNEGCESVIADRCMFGILQAARARISKTEYISCPSCGRTLYDLQTTIARIKEATSHLKGLKIGIMGCIVNGPGEMADADYGYVGAGRHQISLYKGKTCVLRNIPEEEAVERLVQLIKEHGDWDR